MALGMTSKMARGRRCRARMKESGFILDREPVRGSPNFDLIDQARIAPGEEAVLRGVNGASHSSCLM
jgi:hypothetical protein